ncbi:MAG: hypothetical protein CMJ23_12760 [Phycisphaerae bacterium]|nr:hypothetical protein [Phycisphaerae bacterium]
MTPILQWIKSHLVVVICAVVIIAAPVASYVIAGGMTEAARNELKSKASGLRDLKTHRSTTVSLEVPGGQPVSVTATANPNLIAAYQDAVTKISGQTAEVHEAGVKHNRNASGQARGADDLLPGHFPVPPSKRAMEEMPFKLHEALMNAYADLFKQVGAGMPPAAATVAERLERRRVVFVSGQRKDSVSELDPQELEAMQKELAAARLNLYREAATGESGAAPIRFYADESALDLPATPTGLMPLAAMFDWQWKYWITQDLLQAFADANGQDDVINGPMKRVLSLSIAGLGEAAAAPAGGGGQTGGMGGMGGMGAAGMGAPGRSRGGGGGTPAAAPGGTALPDHPGDAQIDPSIEARVDRTGSITGRSSNDVYDIRLVKCSIVASTRGLPAVIDAIAKSNFMTVIDLKLRPANAFDAARGGFIYGIEPVSFVDLTIETVWLREWTADAMPPDLRTMLGIRSNQPAGSAG